MQSDSFLITPMNQRVSLEPGQVYHGSIKVANPSSSTRDFKFEASVSPYSVIGNDYAVNLSEKSDHTMMADWITIDTPSGSLAPNETKNIEFTITVPDTAPGGSPYAAIIVSQHEEDKKSSGVNVDNVLEMASLIYADVDGDIIREGHIISNDVPGFSTVTPVVVSATFDNTGNVHNEAVIALTVTIAITGETIFPEAGNDNQFSELVLPDTTRTVTRNIENLPALGVVNIEQTLYYNGVTSTEAKNLIICPIWFMLSVIAALAIIVGVIIHLIRKARKRKTAAAV